MAVKYICYYNYRDKTLLRENVQSASTKIDYIINVLNRNGIDVDIISKSPVSSTGFRPSLGGKITLAKSKTLRHFFSFGCRKILPLYLISRALNTAHFFVWLLFHTKRGEQIIVYHSLGYTMTLLLLRKIKKIRLIGEIEEIYQDVHKQFALTGSSEYNFINKCDKYIFPTQLLDEKINSKHKPSVIIHGVYEPAQITESKFNDGKIHVVYGGTLDPQKGGAAAAAAAEFLPSNYHVHICGFGDATEIKKIVKDVSSRAKAKITFEGELKGDKYRQFIQKCHIGLSTQNPNAAFNSTSFPSKILMYLANGLKVVSIDIPAIAKSGVKDVISFYHVQSPKDIADAIMRQNDMCGQDVTAVLKGLDAKFSSDILKLLSCK